MLLTSLLSLLLLTPPVAAPPLNLPVPLPPAAPAAAAAGLWSDALKGKWLGNIELPGGESLGYVLTITGPEAALLGISEQGVVDAPLADVAINTATLKFALRLPNAPAGASPVWELTWSDGDHAKGTMRQSGMTLTSTLKRLAAGEDGAPKRPQTPKPPFPYTSREVAYTSFDGAALNGTLTIPAAAQFGKGPFACVLFITGSGIQDRDETLFYHKPFAVIADALARAGVASLRVDDRGYHGAKDPLGGDGTTETFARDTAAGVEFLTTQAEIDAGRIGLLGHSEGGLIAPAVAAAKPALVDFIVLLAAPGVPGKEVLSVQLVAILKAQGASQETIDKAAAGQKVMLAAVATGDEAAVRTLMLDAAKENDPSGTLKGPALESAIDAGMKQVCSPWMRHFLTRDPRSALRETRCPVLILNGGKDVQVVAAQNVPEVTRALLEAGNTCVTARIFPNLNHLFQPVGDKGTGGVSEYNQIETTMDAAVLEEITRWVKAATK
ncbi:alpha/beta fold hydrolase [soil metagenome]